MLKTVVNGSVETHRSYEHGDYIICGTENERYAMRALDFSLRYERARPEPASDPVLAEEGFKLYRPTGKIWARSVSEEDIETHFPDERFMASWGSPMAIEAGDYLAIPFPNGGELYRVKQSAFDKTYSLRNAQVDVPTQAECLAYWEGALREQDNIFCKVGQVNAKVASEPGIIETVEAGERQTSKCYERGDFIVSGVSGEQYAIAAPDFTVRYDLARPEATSEALAAEGFQLFRPTGMIWAHKVTMLDLAMHFPAGEFVASWGSRMVVSAGDYLAIPFPAGGELYRIKASSFSEVYTKRTAMYAPPTSQPEALAYWKYLLRMEKMVFSKNSKLHAKLATEDGSIQSVVSGQITHQNFSQGDFVAHTDKGKHVIERLEFALQYEHARPIEASEELASEGFNLYWPSGRLMAHGLTADDMKTHLPEHRFTTSWGSEIEVEEGDFVVMSFPAGKELYVIKNHAFTLTYVPHTLSDYVPTHQAALEDWEGVLRADGNVYYKTKQVHAKIARDEGVLDGPASMVEGVEGERAYQEGDYIVHVAKGERYVMRPIDFSERYEHSRPSPAIVSSLGDEGFKLYRPTGKIWARKLLEDDVSVHFPSGEFIASSGSPVSVQPGDYLALPFPGGGELCRIKKDKFSDRYALQNRQDYVPSQPEVRGLSFGGGVRVRGAAAAGGG